MPYSKSRARVEFEDNKQKLYKLSKKASYKNSPFGYEHKLLIYQSTIFLLSASIEEYLKRKIEDLVYSYKLNGALLKELPSNTRAYAIKNQHLGTFKSFINNGDESKIIKRLNPKNNAFQLTVDELQFTDQIIATSILAGKKYPSSRNLKTLYNRLGISNVFDILNERGRRKYEEVIDSFMSIREAIAHQEAPTLTFTDVHRLCNDIEEVVNFLDRVTYSHVSKVSGSRFWMT